MTQTTPPKQSRRRGAALDEAVFAAVLAELAERGYAGVTYEGVARRARTSKSVLYRRWPSRAEMVVAALWHGGRAFPATPDTGTLSGDMKALLRDVSRHVDRLGRDVVLGLVSELRFGTATAIFGESNGERLAFVEELLERAHRRGEIGSGPFPEPVLSVPLMLARYYAIVLGRLDEAAIDDIVDGVFLPLVLHHQR